MTQTQQHPTISITERGEVAMKIGRRVQGVETFLASMDGPRVHEYIDLRLYRSEETSYGKDVVHVGFRSQNDWYQSIGITLRGAEQLRDNLNKLLERAQSLSEVK